MDTWGGAQWVMVSAIVVRCILGAAVASGSLTVHERQQSLWAKYWGKRINDALIISLLIWGGFF